MLNRSFILGTILLMSLSAEARHHSGLDISISVAPPPARVVIVPPRGYSHCYLTRAMWVDGIWIPPHQECVYSENTRSSVWVSGYWGCVVPGRHGRCGRWKWLSHHWMRGVTAQEIHEHSYRSDNVHNHGRSEVQVHTHEPNTVHEHNPTLHTR